MFTRDFLAFRLRASGFSANDGVAISADSLRLKAEACGLKASAPVELQ
jgi:hypothetical protein